jgi:16S rRNA (cytidine1402-2'-O)-methyltransferase
MAAALYVVATPIGNLEDISYRAVSILKAVDYIAAEDTRHTLKLLQHYSIVTPMIALHDHSSAADIGRMVELLRSGKNVALVSDAGTPLISDPGYGLVRQLHDCGMVVVPVPGPSAVIAALSVAGLPSDRFCFEGFLPARQSARQERLGLLASEVRTMVFYEAPHRIVECLQDICLLLGEARKVTLARELTKRFETICQKPAADLLAWILSDENQQRGEIVLVVEGAVPQERQALSPQARSLLESLKDELPPKRLSKIVAEHYGISPKEAYEYLLSLKK